MGCQYLAREKETLESSLISYLHRLELLQPLLDQLLDLARILNRNIFSKSISGPSPRIFAEIVGVEFFALAQ